MWLNKVIYMGGTNQLSYIYILPPKSKKDLEYAIAGANLVGSTWSVFSYKMGFYVALFIKAKHNLFSM